MLKRAHAMAHAHAVYFPPSSIERCAHRQTPRLTFLYLYIRTMYNIIYNTYIYIYIYIYILYIVCIYIYIYIYIGIYLKTQKKRFIILILKHMCGKVAKVRLWINAEPHSLNDPQKPYIELNIMQMTTRACSETLGALSWLLLFWLLLLF